jgi:hypothetical protein
LTGAAWAVYPSEMDAIGQLSAEIDASDSVKSSHWKHHTKVGDGFGVIRKSSAMSEIWHGVAQRALYLGSNIFQAEEYSAMKAWCRAQGRVLNQNSLLHAFAIRFLRERVAHVPVTCVIGDGRANFAGLWLKLNDRSRKLISINLPEVLIADTDPLLSSGVVTEAELAVARNPEALVGALTDPVIRVVMVPANLASIVGNAGVGLFVNIASFQEMTPEIVSAYFDIVKQNRAILYCCNREEKTLYGGEVNIFDRYPWSDGRRLVFEECPWYKRFYSSRPPFVGKFDGRTLHALVDFA